MLWRTSAELPSHLLCMHMHWATTIIVHISNKRPRYVLVYAIALKGSDIIDPPSADPAQIRAALIRSSVALH